jgi:DNA-binding HxlR family transcriptional regulator
MSSKELKEIQFNQLITRTFCDTKLVQVCYALTACGKRLKKLIKGLG